MGRHGAPDQSEMRQGWDLNPCDFGSSHRFIRPAHLAAPPPIVKFENNRNTYEK